MQDNFILFSIFFANLLTISSFYISWKTFKSNFNEYILGSIFLILWSINITINNIIELQDPYNQVLSKLVYLFLATAIILMHYYFDEITALYRQRKTMTLGSLVYGGIIGIIFFEDSIIRKDGEIIIGIYLILGLIIQSSLLIYRFFKHMQNQNTLSEFYGIHEGYSSIIINNAKYILMIVFIFSASLILLIPSQILLIASIIPLNFFFISLILSTDPLSSAIIGQELQAVALVSKNKIKYLHVLASTDESFAQDENFSRFLYEINLLLAEISQSETKVRSLSTKEILIMLEPCEEDTLVFILQYRGPLLRKLIARMSENIINNEVNSQIEFSNLVEESLLKTDKYLRYNNIIDKSWTIVLNPKASNFNNAKVKWGSYIDKANTIEISEFNIEWLNENSPSRILILGGDGTVHHIVNIILKSNKDIPVGILPGGAGNDIATRWSKMHKNIHKPNGSEFLEMNVFEIKYSNSITYGINTVEWGIGTPTAQFREDGYGKHLFGMLKYMYLVIKAMKIFRSWSSEISIDNNIIKYNNLSGIAIGFGNSTIGGGYKLFPNEIQNYDQPFIFLAKGYERYQAFKIMIKLASGSHYEEKNIEYHQIDSSVNIIPQTEDPYLLTIDGELDLIPPAEIKISDKVIKTFSVIVVNN